MTGLVAMLGPDDFLTRPKLWWRAYTASIVQHAASVAERLGLRSRVTEVDQADSQFAETPGIVLVDPWLATAHGSDVLASRLRDLPPWVVPVVLEEPPDAIGAQPAIVQEAVTALRNAAAGRVESVHSMVQLDRILPAVVAKARRTYLRQLQITHVPEATKRPPRLRDAQWRLEEDS